MKKERGIDDIFKHKLKDPVDEAAFMEGDWDNFEKMLDKDKRTGKVFWLPWLASVAALLLAVFGWWLFKPQATTMQQNAANLAAVKNSVKHDTIRAQTLQQQAQLQQQTAAIHQPEKVETGVVKPLNPVKDDETNTSPNNVTELTRSDRTQRQYFAIGTKTNMRKANSTNLPAGLNIGDKASLFASTQNVNDTTRLRSALASINPVLRFAPTGNVATPLVASIDILPKGNDRALNNGPVAAIKKTGTSSFRPQFAIMALAASEANGVGSFQSTSSGTNLGLLLSVGVKKLSLSTGATYSTKPYTLPFSDYHTSYQFKNAPETVTADCRVLDIPINLGYQVYNKASNKITLGTGISSYIMMHESYTYDYGASSTVYGPSYYAVKTKGKYLFSIMNLQATYERKINSSVGVTLQPYLKLPLSDIGYSQVKVQTYGVAVGLNWNINPLKKPK